MCCVQVCYKKSDFLGDQVLLTGFALAARHEMPPSHVKIRSKFCNLVLLCKWHFLHHCLVSCVQVCYKKTDFLGDQVLLTGFAPGGLTEVPQADFKTCSMANTLAQELGPFGFKPEVLALSFSVVESVEARQGAHSL